MSQLKISLIQTLQRSTSLLAAVEAPRNWRALVLLIGTFVAGAVLFGAGAALAAPVHISLLYGFGLLALLVLFYGTNAVGISLMHDAKGAPPASPGTALLMALATGHRLLAVLLLAALLCLSGVVVMALLLLLGKIPGLGPVLLTALFPAVALLGGGVALGLAVLLPLAAPAVWDGATIFQTVSRLIALARARFVNVMLTNLLLNLIVAMVAAVVFAVVMLGTAFATAMSIGVVGLGQTNLLALMGGQGAGMGQFLAAALGGGLLWIVALCLVGLVVLRGSCEVYLANVEGLDAGAIEAQLSAKLAAGRQRLHDVQAQAAAAQATLAAAAVIAAERAPAPDFTAPLTCPACHATVTVDDRFCGGCGHKRF